MMMASADGECGRSFRAQDIGLWGTANGFCDFYAHYTLAIEQLYLQLSYLESPLVISCVGFSLKGKI